MSWKEVSTESGLPRRIFSFDLKKPRSELMLKRLEYGGAHVGETWLQSKRIFIY